MPQPLDTPKGNAMCWICRHPVLKLVKPGNAPAALTSSDFAITDSRYGVTSDVYRCEACGFLECPYQADVLPFYEQLVDSSYEEGRAERSLQQKQLLELVAPRGGGKRLLDIGAGTGMLVEQALNLGYQAEGVEPSDWSQSMAARRNLTVLKGIFPHPLLRGPYDVVTLVDVIEHVPNPVELLAAIRDVLAPGGVTLIITPDVKSIAARLLGGRWWHYRLAHIGYFSHGTLQLALENAGLEPEKWGRPAWYFRGDYLARRVQTYLPKFMRMAPPKWLRGTTIPLNLRDSMYTICRSGCGPDR